MYNKRIGVMHCSFYHGAGTRKKKKKKKKKTKTGAQSAAGKKKKMIRCVYHGEGREEKES